MSTIKKTDDELNAMTQTGRILEALDRFYSEECIFQEGNEQPRRGRQAQREHLSRFFDTLKEFRGATLHSQGVGEDVTLTEWTFDMVGPEGPIVWNEILRRKWLNGKVVSERYYAAA